MSATTVVTGSLLMIPLGLHRREEADDATPIVPFMVTGTTLIVLGSIATLITATCLAHHRRWDAPPRRLIGDAQQASRAEVQRRKLLQTLAAAGGIAVAGGLVIGIGYGAAAACDDAMDSGCSNRRATVGVAVAGPLILGGGFAALSSGILLGLHKRHRHREIDPYAELYVGAGSLTMKF